MSFVGVNGQAYIVTHTLGWGQYRRSARTLQLTLQARIMKGVIMNIKFDRAGMSLDKDSFIRVQGAAGTCVQCRKGSLWITQDKDIEDYVLGPGQALELEHDGDAIIFALMQSELVLREPKEQHPIEGFGNAIGAIVRTAGQWIAARFGPHAISSRNLRGWYGTM